MRFILKFCFESNDEKKKKISLCKYKITIVIFETRKNYHKYTAE